MAGLRQAKGRVASEGGCEAHPRRVDETAHEITRADVAGFLLEALENGS